jgi:hypothetical protein
MDDSDGSHTTQIRHGYGGRALQDPPRRHTPAEDRLPPAPAPVEAPSSAAAAAAASASARRAAATQRRAAERKERRKDGLLPAGRRFGTKAANVFN